MMKTKKMRMNYWLLAVSLSVAVLFLFSVRVEAKMHFSKKTISHVQQELKGLGYYKGETSGVLNEETTAAVKTFQKEHKLKADGIPGKMTRKALFQAVKRHKAAG
jgi:peptidoglycan hydrolase-like protein with peptidoglycan-binding domain